MPRSDSAIEVTQATVLQPVDQAVNANLCAAGPSPLQDRRFADAAYTFDYVELGEAITAPLDVELSA